MTYFDICVAVQYYGKVKSNFVGTEFVMHDKGVKPADAEQAPVANLRKELGVVL